MTVLASSLTGCATMQSTSGSSLYNPAQRVFLVRHAERFNDSRDDPPLTAEGKGRAKALADTPRDARVSAIITSQWMRAKDTAQPLAELLRIAPEGIPTVDPPHGYFQATANACDDEEPIQFWSLDTSRFPASSPSLAVRNYRRSVKACFRFVPAGSGSGVGRPHTASLRLSGGDFAAQPKIQVTGDRIETSSDEIRSDLDPHVINILIAQLSRESTYGPTRTCD